MWQCAADLSWGWAPKISQPIFGDGGACSNAPGREGTDLLPWAKVLCGKQGFRGFSNLFQFEGSIFPGSKGWQI